MATGPRRFAALRSKYRREHDAFMFITGRNRRLTEAGKQPPYEELAGEHLAAAAVRLARAELQAAISWAGRPEGLKAVGSQYKAAFDAYHAIVAARARQALAGDPTSIDELRREEEARAALALAKRALLDAFGPCDRSTPFRQKLAVPPLSPQRSSP
jgi:hypothetical protein